MLRRLKFLCTPLLMTFLPKRSFLQYTKNEPKSNQKGGISMGRKAKKEGVSDYSTIEFKYDLLHADITARIEVSA